MVARSARPDARARRASNCPRLLGRALAGALALAVSILVPRGTAAAEESAAAPQVIGAISYGEKPIAAASAAFLPGGMQIVTAGLDGVLEVRDVRTGKPARTLEVRGGARFLLVSADGARLFADDVSADGAGRSASAIDLASGKVERSFHAPERIEAAALSPDGTRIALADAALGVRVLDVKSGAEVLSVAGDAYEQRGQRLAFSPDGKALAFAHGGAPVRLFDLAGKGATRTLGEKLTGPPNLLAFLEDGRLAFAQGSDLIRTFRVDGSAEEPFGASFGPSSGSIGLSESVLLGRSARVAALQGKELTVIDIALRRPVVVAGIEPEASGGQDYEGRRLIASPDGKCVALVRGRAGLVLFARVDQALAEGRHDRSHRGAGICFGPDGRTVLTASAQGGVAAWDAETGERRSEIPGGMRLTNALAAAPGGALFALAGSVQDGIPILDARAGKELRRCGGRDSPHVNDIAFSHDGKMLAAGCGDGLVRAFDVATAKEAWRSAPVGRRAGAVAFSPDGKDIWAAAEAGIAILDAKTGKAKRTLKAHEGSPVQRLASSPGAGGRVASIADRHAALVLWTPAGAPKRSIAGPEDGFLALALSPDGKLVAASPSSGARSALRIFDATSGAPVLDVDVFRKADAVAFSSDGRRVAVGFGSSRMQVFSLGPSTEAPPKKGK